MFARMPRYAPAAPGTRTRAVARRLYLASIQVATRLEALRRHLDFVLAGFTDQPTSTQQQTPDQPADDTDHPVEPTRSTRRYPIHVGHRQSG